MNGELKCENLSDGTSTTPEQFANVDDIRSINGNGEYRCVLDSELTPQCVCNNIFDFCKM